MFAPAKRLHYTIVKAKKIRRITRRIFNSETNEPKIT
jgi:hypothetical protein